MGQVKFEVSGKPTSFCKREAKHTKLLHLDCFNAKRSQSFIQMPKSLFHCCSHSQTISPNPASLFSHFSPNKLLLSVLLSSSILLSILLSPVSLQQEEAAVQSHAVVDVVDVRPHRAMLGIHEALSVTLTLF